MPEVDAFPRLLALSSIVLSLIVLSPIAPVADRSIADRSIADRAYRPIGALSLRRNASRHALSANQPHRAPKTYAVNLGKAKNRAPSEIRMALSGRKIDRRAFAMSARMASAARRRRSRLVGWWRDRKSTRLNSSHMSISY